ncbi:MAG: monovalent cation:proton antiporter-2 (CPA2) family protein [Hyphomicrobiaceae bacterium]|nr:monovalent cation:proton antiporter-2 (CPA2) family protein [Hyphomicrobiaceae bacterium]
MAAETTGGDLGHVVALLTAAVIAVPLFKKLGLGSVLGYLAAGVAIGPFGLRLFTDGQSILHVAELGVVMLLFIIGLEMMPSRLWGLRKQIFGLGLAQVAAAGAILTVAGIYYGFTPAVAFVAAMGFVMTSTAVVLQVIEERGETSTPAGQKIVSILLLEDLAIVPLLAVVAFLSPTIQSEAGLRWQPIALALGSVAILIVAGRFLLNPLFRLLASVRAREIMTAAALLVVLGSALLMQVGGLSAAMGAFLAGVLLSESSFRHQLEADVEPFRGLLLGLFFLSVGMTLDLSLMAREWRTILASVAVYMTLKALAIWLVAVVFRSSANEATHRAALMAQGGEFAFVLYAAGVQAGILDGPTNAALSATVILSMALTPLLVLGLRYLPTKAASMDGIDEADDLKGTVLIIGFGRVGQVMSQLLLARGVDVAIIDTDTEMIRSAEEFGFKVYYGDGTRLDVLHASGAASARAIGICVDKKDATDKIVELAKAEFPNAQLLVRSFDREHALELIKQGVDLQMRETFESALVLGGMALKAVGASEAEAAEIVEDIRRRDAERFKLEVVGGLSAGVKLLHSNRMKPTPLTPPKRNVAAASAAGATAPAEAATSPSPPAATATSTAAPDSPQTQPADASS